MLSALRRWVVAVVVSGMMLPVSSDRSNAEVVVIGFTAEVLWVDDVICSCLPLGAIEVGDPLVGFYTYETTTPDGDTNPSVGSYWHTQPPHRMVVYHENYTFASDPDAPSVGVVLTDSVNMFGWHGYTVYSYNNLDDPFQPFQTMQLLDIALRDHSGTVLSSDSLIAPDLEQWPDARRLDIYGDDFAYRISAEITSMGFGPPSGITPPARRGLYLLNHPNPFNPATTIRFGVPVSGDVAVEIFDVSGRRVRTLLEGVRERGREHVLEWNGKDDSGRTLPSGVYFAVLRTARGTVTHKLVLIR
jgi:hypothetical protein